MQLVSESLQVEKEGKFGKCSQPLSPNHNPTPDSLGTNQNCLVIFTLTGPNFDYLISIFGYPLDAKLKNESLGILPLIV